MRIYLLIDCLLDRFRRFVTTLKDTTFCPKIARHFMMQLLSKGYCALKLPTSNVLIGKSEFYEPVL